MRIPPWYLSVVFPVWHVVTYIKMCEYGKWFNRTEGTAHFGLTQLVTNGPLWSKSSVTFCNCQRCLSCAHATQTYKNTADGMQERFLCKQLFTLLLPPVVTAPLINFYAFILKDSCTSTDHSFNKYTVGVWCVCMCFGWQEMLRCSL